MKQPEISGKYVFNRWLAAVAAAILAAVEDGILPSGMVPPNAELMATPARRSAGQDAWLTGRRDARFLTFASFRENDMERA